MARNHPVPNHLKKRLKRQERQRKMATRQPRQYFLIVCEGQKTEPLYFEALKKDLPKGVLENVTVDIQGIGKNTVQLIREAIQISDERSKRLVRQYDQIWAVFDRDSFPPNHFNEAIDLAQNNQPEIHCAWSNEAFELWYLLHFNYIHTPISRKDYPKKLENRITQKTGKNFSYTKNTSDMYNLLKSWGDQNQAITRAEKLEAQYQDEDFASHNPCTRVHHLIKALLLVKD